MFELVYVLEDHFHILVIYCMDLWEINKIIIIITDKMILIFKSSSYVSKAMTTSRTDES
jgi:hypothetical protein